MGEEMLMNRKALGDLGEEFAARVLENEGYVILERKYRNKIGEIDIIALKDSALTFIEVKTRQTERMGMPREAVNWRKKQKITAAAKEYAIRHNDLWEEIHFQVFEVYSVQISHAFTF